MSPVRQSKTRGPRSVVLAVGGVTIGVVLVIALFIVAIPSLTESGKIEVKLGDDVFDAGSAESRSKSIAADGPFLFGDPSGRTRDIFLQHIGDDPTQGWYAFDARRPGQGRDCPLDWKADQDRFVDRCDGTVIPADGTGLIDYPVVVTENGALVVDLNPEEGDDISTLTTGG
ncbi:MAG TPA: hypothetical protein VIY72_08345 [Acidimicrobiales bacterium]